MSVEIVGEDDEYVFEIMQEHHLPACAVLLADSFTKQNPMSLHLGITYDESYPLTLCRAECILNDRLSLVAIHKQSNELHGCMQASDAKTLKEYPPVLPTENTSGLALLEPVNDLLAELEEKYFAEYHKVNGGELKEQCVVQMLLGATRVGHEGRGLGSKLRRLTLNHARQRGFKYAIVELSNPAAHHIYTKKLGGREFTSVYAPTWLWKKNGHNSFPFEHFTREMALIVVDL